jgi:catechol 2,3-dioxygenase-like lactoylglutathione lyase family enzyme
MSLLAGLNHVAILTADLDRFVDFYTRVFDLKVVFNEETPAFRHAILRISGQSWLHPAEVKGNPHGAAVPRLFDRGHLDHIALAAAGPMDFERLRRRLVRKGASNGEVEDLGAFRAMWFKDPDGMRGELVLVMDTALRGIHEPRKVPVGVVSAAGAIA